MTLQEQIIDLKATNEYRKVLDLVKDFPVQIGQSKPFSRFEENVPDVNNKLALELKRKFERDKYRLCAYQLLH